MRPGLRQMPDQMRGRYFIRSRHSTEDCRRSGRVFGRPGFFPDQPCPWPRNPGGQRSSSRYAITSARSWGLGIAKNIFAPGTSP